MDFTNTDRGVTVTARTNLAKTCLFPWGRSYPSKVWSRKTPLSLEKLGRSAQTEGEETHLIGWGSRHSLIDRGLDGGETLKVRPLPMAKPALGVCKTIPYFLNKTQHFLKLYPGGLLVPLSIPAQVSPSRRRSGLPRPPRFPRPSAYDKASRLIQLLAEQLALGLAAG